MIEPELTKEQGDAVFYLLTQIGSWTEARWDQHLRYIICDEEADAIIAWMGKHVDSRLGKPDPGRKYNDQ
jgi:hypothetical protein